MPKIYSDKSVYSAAQKRIRILFDDFPRVYVSFSGGKDSTVMLHMVAAEARRRGRRFGGLFVDLEGQYQMTIDHIRACIERHADIMDFQWVALPLSLRNAVSEYEPKWLCWDPDAEASWIRPKPPEAIEAPDFFESGMEFEDFVPKWGEWYSNDEPTACLVGIRTDESLNRFRSLANERKSCWKSHPWTTWVQGNVFNAYPLYDWRTEDIWTYHARTSEPYNPLYDYMQRAGVPLGHQRICQPYGDDQRRGLWLFHIIEPATWSRVVARVNGANSGALYAQETGNILGNLKITRPAGHTWESFAMMILGSLPDKASEHYSNKIAVFIQWWQDRGYPNGIPDEIDPKLEASRAAPSWRRVCKTLLRHDWWCKGIGFSMTKAASYSQYLKVMRNRRRKWGLLAD